MNDQHHHDNTDTANDSINWPALSWWLFLITAVLAIPSLAFVIVTIAGISGAMGICVFMVSCLVATYLGKHLVNHPNMHKKRDFTECE